MTDFAEHQDRMAKWMGYPDADAMNLEHDATHAALCDWLGIESHALKEAAGETLDRWGKHLAAIEEDAVLNVQRLMRQAGGRLP